MVAPPPRRCASQRECFLAVSSIRSADAMPSHTFVDPLRADRVLQVAMQG
jgi:hypothetical protein